MALASSHRSMSPGRVAHVGRTLATTSRHRSALASAARHMVSTTPSTASSESDVGDDHDGAAAAGVVEQEGDDLGLHRVVHRQREERERIGRVGDRIDVSARWTASDVMARHGDPQGGNGDVMNIGGSTISVREGCHPVAVTTSCGPCLCPVSVLCRSRAVRTRRKPAARHGAEPRPMGSAPLPRRAGRRGVGSRRAGGRCRQRRTEWQVARLSIELTRPVPVMEPLTIATRGRAAGSQGVARGLGALQRRRRRGGASPRPAHSVGRSRPA